MKTSTLTKTAGTLALVLASALCLSSCKEKKSSSTKPLLRVGMECAYAPFNWTQDSKTTKQEMMEEQSTLTEDKAKSQIHTSQITKQKMVEQFTAPI